MARTFIINTKYKADGSDVLKTQTRMSKGFGRFAGQMADGNSMIGKSFTRLNQGINRGLMVAFTALIGMVGLATAEYVKFDQTIVGANTRFVDFVQGSEQSVKTLENLKVAAREVGKTTQFSGVQAAQGLNFYAKAGFTSAEAMAVLADTVNLATVAEADFNRTADISSDLLGALGKNVDDSVQKIQNLKDINRALGITANSANVDLEDLFETLKVAAPIATAAGEGMNELFAITGALGGAGIKGSMGATALKNAYIRLAAPTDKIRANLEKLGLTQKDFIDNDGKMKSMVNIMQQLGDASANLGEAEQLGIFAEIFGKNAVAGAVNLAGSLSEVELIMKKLESATALKDLADEIRKGLGMQIEILKSGLIELGFKFVEAFEKDGRGALQNLIDTVQTVDITPLINFATIIGKIFKFVAKNWKILISLAAGIKAVSAAMVILNILTTTFGVILQANVVGMIITAVFLLASAIVWLVLNWDKVIVVLKIVWKWIANVGQKFLFLLGPMGLVISGIIEVVKNFGKIKKAFQTEGIIAGLKAIGSAFLTGLMIPLKKAWELLKTFGKFLGGKLLSIFKEVGNWIATTGQRFTFLFGTIGLVVSAIIEIVKQFGKIKEAFKEEGFIAGIKAIGSAILDGLITPITEAWSWINKLGDKIAGFLIPIFQKIGEWIANTGQKFTFLLGPIGFLVSALIEIASQWDTIKESFASGGILGGILAIGRALLSGLLAPMEGFLNMLSNIPGIGNLAEGLSDKLGEIRAGLEVPEPKFPDSPKFPDPEPTRRAFDPNQAFSLGRPETPTPNTPPGELIRSSLDINIKNGAGDNAEVKQKGNMPTGTKMNFVPALSL